MKATAPLLIALAAAASAAPASASEIEVFPLGPSNTLVKIHDPARYLILPVQESQADSKIDVIVNGELAQTIFVRLAESNIDYTVPFDLSAYAPDATIVLNVVSEVDRTHSREASDYICWENLELADTFDTSNREQHRPAYHHTPLYGWMNDPNGMFYKDGVWHLYYQYNPYGSKWQNLSWGHSTSTDLLNWEHQPVALVPDGLGMIFSGSSVVDATNTAGLGDSTVVAIYTSAATSQVQSMAYSHDNGQTFTTYPANPIIPNLSEARDPNMFWYEPNQEWVLVLAHALEKEMQIYTSPNLIDWTLRSSFGKGYGSQGGVWECPDLFELPVEGTDMTKWVLLCNINPGAPMGGSGTQYFTGEFDGHTFTPDEAPSVQKWMDYGKDHYAAVTWSDAPAGRRTAVAWMSNWQYANEVPTQQFRSANTLPRELGLFQGPDGGIYLKSTPAPEVETLRKAKKTYGNALIGHGGRRYNIPELCEIDIDYDAAACSSITIELSNHAGEKVTIDLDFNSDSFKMDRRFSGATDFSRHFPAVTTAPMHKGDREGQLRIFIDRCSVEAFDGNGRFTMTDLVFPTSPYTTMTISAKGGKADIRKVDVYTF